MSWIFVRKKLFFNETFEEKRFLVGCQQIRKIPDHCNAKRQYQWFIRKKNWKSVKQSKIITCQPKTFDTVGIKSIIIEHPKTSHKLSEAIKQTIRGHIGILRNSLPVECLPLII